MEKITFNKVTVLHETFYESPNQLPWYDPKNDLSGDYYRASDVDALRAAVKELVEASKAYAEMTVKVLDGRSNKIDAIQVASNLGNAIAAVERLEG